VGGQLYLPFPFSKVSLPKLNIYCQSFLLNFYLTPRHSKRPLVMATLSNPNHPINADQPMAAKASKASVTMHSIRAAIASVFAKNLVNI
jgi:hypothetical protein